MGLHWGVRRGVCFRLEIDLGSAARIKLIVIDSTDCSDTTQLLEWYQLGGLKMILTTITFVADFTGFYLGRYIIV